MKYFLIIAPIFILLSSCNKEKKELEKYSPNNTILYQKALSYFNIQQIDSAFYQFNECKNLSVKNKDSITAAKCLTYMAIIQTNAGDYYGGQETALEGLKYCEKTPYNDLISSLYNCIAIASYNLQDYPTSISQYKKALSYISDDNGKQIYQNNLAVSYIKQKQYTKAVEILKPILLQDSLETYLKSKVIDNFAYARWLQNQQYNPEKELLHALSIRIQEKDEWGQNASYAHLTDYFTAKNKNQALGYAHKMYETAVKLKSPDDQLEALQKLINLENITAAQIYFKKYIKLDDSLQLVRSRAKNQFALIRYESEKNKNESLRLKIINEQKDYQLLKQRFLIGGTLGIALFGFLFSVFWHRKREQHFHQEKILATHKIALLYSKKIHDEVANGIYNIMVWIQNQEILQNNLLLDKLDKLYEKSRDISYKDETGQPFSMDLQARISQLLNDYASINIKILFSDNSAGIWRTFSTQKSEDIYLVLQELMTNMKKHSQATIVSVVLKKEDNQFIINYFDNGIGISDSTIFKNGLHNAENRIKKWNGSFTFESNNSNGCKIIIKTPL